MATPFRVRVKPLHTHRSTPAATGLPGRWAFLAALGAAACSPEPTGNTATRFVEALNRHAVSEAASYLGPDATVRLDTVELTRPEVAEWMRWDSVLGTTRSVHGWVSRGDTLVAEGVTEHSRALALLGITAIERTDMGLVVTGESIREVVVGPPTDASSRDLDRQLADFLPWAQHEYPERLRRIRPGDRFAYGARPAAEWLSLLRQWLARGR